jgi:nitrous oxidase accessory protein NosD
MSPKAIRSILVLVLLVGLVLAMVPAVFADGPVAGEPSAPRVPQSRVVPSKALSVDTVATVYVRPGGDDATCDGTANVDAPGSPAGACAVKTINKGIEKVDAGGTVHVAAGTYVEDPVINKALTLLGPNSAINPNTGTRVAEAVILPASSGTDPYGTCEVMALLSVSNVTIKGFTFDGDNPSLTSGVMIGTADVNACEILAGWEGVGNIVVENNILKHSTYTGIDFDNYTNPAATAGNYIRYNRLEDMGETTYNWGIGVLIYDNFYADITNNVFTGVRVGIQTGNFSAANPGTTGSISNNQIGVWRLGIFHNLAYSNASPLTISDNTITAETYPGATKWNGLLLSSIGGAVNATISNNDIVIPGAVFFAPPGYTAGYNVWNVTTTAPIAISGGIVTGGDYGVFVNNYEGYSSDAGNTAVKIDGVTVLDSAIAGVYVKDSPSNTNNATVYANIQNCTLDTNATGILVAGADASAKANSNKIAGNPTAGVTNTSGVLMDAKNNWWGSATGPGSVGPGSGDLVSTLVDYDPWSLALVTMAPSAAAEVGDTVTMDTMVTAGAVFGMQLRVSFDSDKLEFQAPPASSYNHVAAAGWYWDYVPENFLGVSGGRRLSGSMQDPPHASPAMLTGQSVATWKFKCLKAGTWNLTYDQTPGLGTYLATKDSSNIPATLTNATVQCLAATASVDGWITLQGRQPTNPVPAAWQGADVKLTCVALSGCDGFGPYTMTTDASGHYQWLKTATPGSGVVLGTYSATVSRRAYLGAAKTANVVVGPGPNTINTLATAPRLLGGDVNGEPGITIGDLSAIGGVFGSTVTPADTGKDVNGDGFVNIFDLVLAGGNLDKTFPQPW